MEIELNMAALTLYPDDERLDGAERTVFHAYLLTSMVLFLLMMLAGVSMRMGQAGWLGLAPNRFYEVLSLHGAGMVGTASLATTAIMWYFLRKYVRLHLWAFVLNYVLYVAGIAQIVLAVFLGGYAGAWTMLYPFPAQSMGQWGPFAAASFMLGYLTLGTGLLVFYLDCAAGIIGRYGNFTNSLGAIWFFGGEIDPSHPATVIVSTAIIIANFLGVLAGAIAVVLSLVNLYVPSIRFDPLVMKELIYWFGHMVANATILMGVIGCYELLPRYTGRPHVLHRGFIWAYSITCVSVIFVVPHHLFMDFAQPQWMTFLGQLLSWGEGFPVYFVTAYFVLSTIYRSGRPWAMPSILIVLALFGWSAGVIPAILDGTIMVNRYMHNTMWVDGHFHFYLILGALPLIFATMYHVAQRRMRSAGIWAVDKVAVPLYLAGGLVFVLAFLGGGAHGVPRRYNVHDLAWLSWDRMGSVGAMLILLGFLYLATSIILDLVQRPRP